MGISPSCYILWSTLLYRMGMAPSCYIIWSTLQYRHGDGTILLCNVKHSTIQTWVCHHHVIYCEAQYNTDMGMAPSCYIMWSTVQYRHGVGTILLHNVKHAAVQTWVCHHHIIYCEAHCCTEWGLHHLVI